MGPVREHQRVAGGRSEPTLIFRGRSSQRTEGSGESSERQVVVRRRPEDVLRKAEGRSSRSRSLDTSLASR